MRVPLPEHRFSVERLPTGIRFTIPVARNWFGIIFICAWLGGWYFGERSAIGELLKASDRTPIPFLAFWLAGWTAGGVAVMASVLWQLFGREIVETENGALARRVQVGSLGLTREYNLADVRSLRATTLDATMVRGARAFAFPFGRSAGAVAFDYGGRTIRFGGQLDEAEATRIVELLKPFLPKS